MFFLGLGTATPPQSFTQRECWAAIQASPQFAGLEPRSQAVLRRVLTGANGITRRTLAFDHLAEAFDITAQVQHDRFARHAPALAAQAGRAALERAGCTARQMDAVLVSTCTGSLCPGLTSYLIEALGLRDDILALDLVGQGCGAALPNLAAAAGLLSGGQAARVLSVCVEVCSAAMYLDDDTGVLISACLFGDGAAAAVLGTSPPVHGPRVEWQRGVSLTATHDRELLRFENRNGCLRNILRPEVPDRAAYHVQQVLRKSLSDQLSASDIAVWVLHPGGRNVLRAIRSQLELPEEATRWSAAVLNDHGNLSSPSVWFVLERALAGGAPPGWWWMSAFGAGFSCHGALLRVSWN